MRLVVRVLDSVNVAHINIDGIFLKKKWVWVEWVVSRHLRCWWTPTSPITLPGLETWLHSSLQLYVNALWAVVVEAGVIGSLPLTCGIWLVFQAPGFHNSGDWE